jgi:hypothetical protein
VDAADLMNHISFIFQLAGEFLLFMLLFAAVATLVAVLLQLL